MSASTTQDVPDGCVEPRELDILVGKSTQCRRHKGSKCFALFVASYTQRYQEATNKHKKGELTYEMYAIITKASYRFLRFDESKNGWIEVTSTEARDKITHAIKYNIKKQERQQRSNTPQRQHSDSSRRSESSNLSGASSLDWEQLYSNQQRQLGSSLNLSHMHSSLRASRVARRSSLSSVGSGASNLSREDSGTSLSMQPRPAAQNKSVSFSSTDTGRTMTTIATTQSVESEPLPVDLSTTQHFDMTTSFNRDIFDRTPIPPSRPAYDDEAGVSFEGDVHDMQFSSHEQADQSLELERGEDALVVEGKITETNHAVAPTSSVMDSHHSNTSNDMALLGPLLEVDHDDSSNESSNNTTPPHSNVGTNSHDDSRFEGIGPQEFAFAESFQRLELSDVSTQAAAASLDSHLFASDTAHDISYQIGNFMDAANNIMPPSNPTDILPLESNILQEDNEFRLLDLDLDSSAGPSQHTGEHHHRPTSTDPSSSSPQEYSFSLMQDPVMEWEPS